MNAAALLDLLRANSLKLVTAESCTGGLAAAELTAVTGSSDVFERGFVTYSNEAKTEMLGVPPEFFATFGAVSEETVRAMAEGALARSKASIAVSVTGVAGPGGGTELKPVGLVHIACARSGVETLHQRLAFGNLERNEIRSRSVTAMFELVKRQALAP